MNEQDILQVLADKGMRITAQRKTLARLFSDENKSFSPKEVYDEMEREYPGLSFDTVYRNLRIMNELGVLEQFIFKEGVRFKLRCAVDNHHHHLICLECERTISIDFCPMHIVPGLPDQFEVIRHKFEVYGYCRQCRTKNGGLA